MYVLTQNMWFQRLIIQFCFFIDKIVYSFISLIYDLLITIARTSVLTQGDIAEFSDRIYKLLAVFMVFKVTFSLIMYVVNPDDFTDKGKGIGKLGSNIAISLSLLILTPYIFNLAYELQAKVLESNVLAELVMGDKGEQNQYLNSAGDDMAYATLSAFFSPNLAIEELLPCSNLLDPDGSFNDECRKAFTDDIIPKSGNYNADLFQNYTYGVERQNLELIFRQDLALATYTDNNKEEVFIMAYKPIFSTAVGIVVTLLLLTFCMDIAVRSLKLSFLQLAAPIPVISLVDPKSGKDGLFKKWYEMCFKTYISLFVRLISLYFGVWIIGKVSRWKMIDLVNGSYQTNKFVGIFIIIGTLMFIKQLPKILEGLGIKLDGGAFTLNPLKKMENDMIGGKRVSSFLKAAPAAALAGGAAFGTNLLARKGNVFSAAAGALSATTKGLKGAMKGEKFGKNFSNSYGTAMKNRQNRKERKDLGIGWFDYKFNQAEQRLGMETKGQRLSRINQQYKELSSATKSAKTEAESLIAKKGNSLLNDYSSLGLGQMSLEQATAQAQVLENNGNANGAADLRAAIGKNKSDWAKILQDEAKKGTMKNQYRNTTTGFEYASGTFDASDEVPIAANLEAAEQVLKTSPDARRIYEAETGTQYDPRTVTADALGKAGKAAGNEATRTSTEERVQTTLDKQGAKGNSK